MNFFLSGEHQTWGIFVLYSGEDFLGEKNDNSYMFILFSGEILKKKKRKTKVSMIILRIIF
jgi:hypothetical protein